MQRVLILCTGNSCRSQMAEALWRSLGDGEWETGSAGSNPSGFIHPIAVRVMQERGIDISEARSKSLDEFRDKRFDLVVTVCDNAKASCPVFTGATETLHWPFDDPAKAEGSEDDQLAVFRRVRDEIEHKIFDFLKSGNS